MPSDANLNLGISLVVFLDFSCGDCMFLSLLQVFFDWYLGLKMPPGVTNYKYPLGSRQVIQLCSKARGGKIVDYSTDEQRSYGDKAPEELGVDLQFRPRACWISNFFVSFFAKKNEKVVHFENQFTGLYSS